MFKKINELLKIDPIKTFVLKNIVNRPLYNDNDHALNITAAHEAGHAFIAMENNFRIKYGSIVEIGEYIPISVSISEPPELDTQIFRAGGIAGVLYFKNTMANRHPSEININTYLEAQVGSSFDFHEFIIRERFRSTGKAEVKFYALVRECLKTIVNNPEGFRNIMTYLTEQQFACGINIANAYKQSETQDNLNEDMLDRINRGSKIPYTLTSKVHTQGRRFI